MAERLSATRFRVRAELPVRMTDFSITPPTALFGMIKANDTLVVSLDVILEAAPGVSTRAAFRLTLCPRSNCN